MPTLHVHLDESGDFNFSPKGSRFYVFTAAWTYDPAPLANSLTSLRFSLLKAGHDIRAFHASTDRQVNRDAVVNLISTEGNWAFGAVVIEKPKVYRVLWEPHRFYPQFASSVLKYHGSDADSTRPVPKAATLGFLSGRRDRASIER